MEDLLYVIDRDDNVLGKDSRQSIHKTERWHRGIHILLLSPEGRLLLTVRSKTKDKFPNTYDLSVSGHVDYGETYEQTARREAEEELGIEELGLRPILKFRLVYGPNDNMISILYEAEYDGKINMDPSEVQSAELLSLDEIKGKLLNNPEQFAQWTREILRWYLHMPSRVEKIEGASYQ